MERQRVLSCPMELRSIAPNAAHDHGEPARQGDNGFLPATAFGHIHRPGFQPGPFDGAGQHDLRRFIEKRPHHAVATLRNPANTAAFTRLIEYRR